MIPAKEYIREKYKKKRAALSDQDKMVLDQKIKARAIDWLKSGDFPKKVHLFLPIQKQKEVDTFPLLEWFWENGWDVYSSKISSESLDMEIIFLEPNTSFNTSTWGIPFPKYYQVVEVQEFSLIFLPLLAYDRSGYRIGFGKGYYDKFLADIDFDPVKVGLSYFVPEPSLPCESHDIPLDFCITPEKIFTF